MQTGLQEKVEGISSDGASSSLVMHMNVHIPHVLRTLAELKPKLEDFKEKYNAVLQAQQDSMQLDAEPSSPRPHFGFPDNTQEREGGPSFEDLRHDQI